MVALFTTGAHTPVHWAAFQSPRRLRAFNQHETLPLAIAPVKVLARTGTHAVVRGLAGVTQNAEWCCPADLVNRELALVLERISGHAQRRFAFQPFWPERHQ